MIPAERQRLIPANLAGRGVMNLSDPVDLPVAATDVMVAGGPSDPLMEAAAPGEGEARVSDPRHREAG